jgi:hypothetical protein
LSGHALKALAQAKRRWVTAICEGTKYWQEKVINSPESGCRLGSAIHKVHLALQVADEQAGG